MRRRPRRWLRRFAVVVAAAPIALLVALNGTVRWIGGGDANLVSPFHVRDKAVAVARLAAHLPFHYFRTCGEDPRSMLRRTAAKHGLPVNFVLAVAKHESRFLSHRISHTGAMGVMQLMPGTADELGVGDPFDPEQNAAGAARFLGKLWTRYGGNRQRVAAAYNAGPGAVPIRGPMRLSAETREYVRRVTGK